MTRSKRYLVEIIQTSYLCEMTVCIWRKHEQNDRLSRPRTRPGSTHH